MEELPRISTRKTKPILRKSLTTGQLRVNPMPNEYSSGHLQTNYPYLAQQHNDPGVSYSQINPYYTQQDQSRGSGNQSGQVNYQNYDHQRQTHTKRPSNVTDWTHPTQITRRTSITDPEEYRHRSTQELVIDARNTTRRVICVTVVIVLVFVGIIMAVYFILLQRQCMLKFEDHRICRGFNGVLQGSYR